LSKAIPDDSEDKSAIIYEKSLKFYFSMKYGKKKSSNSRFFGEERVFEIKFLIMGKKIKSV